MIEMGNWRPIELAAVETALPGTGPIQKSLSLVGP